MESNLKGSGSSTSVFILLGKYRWNRFKKGRSQVMELLTVIGRGPRVQSLDS